MSTGKRIRAIREQRKLTRQGLATRLGTTRMTVWRVEADRTPLRTDALDRWAEALETTVADLLGLDAATQELVA